MAKNQTTFHFESDFTGEEAEDSIVDAINEIDETEEIFEEPTIFSVGELNSVIRQKLEGEFAEIWVRGEISNFKPHTSGHYYFSLKDEDAQVSAVMFRGHNAKLKFRPENGLEVLVKGKITVYEPRGNYQVFCEFMEPVGAGALQKAFEQLKAKLQAEGLFDSARKRPLPKYPRHIGLVTSPTGAAIQDILNILRRRYRSARVTLAPAIVQGDKAADSIVAALQMINRVPDIDVLIVGRGGGSIEDMWCFNEEKVARAIAASRIPVVSAVGHEIDFTIADFVADLRAPTPSAAAELVAKSATELIEKIQNQKARLWQAFKAKMLGLATQLDGLLKRLVSPERRLQELAQRNDEVITRLEAAMFRYLAERARYVELVRQKMGNPRERLARLSQRAEMAIVRLKSLWQRGVEQRVSRVTQAMGRLDALSPLRVVERGYSIVERADGKTQLIVKSTDEIKTGDLLRIRFAKGEAQARVESLSEKISEKS